MWPNVLYLIDVFIVGLVRTCRQSTPQCPYYSGKSQFLTRSRNPSAVVPPEFCNKGEGVRYGSIGGLEYAVPVVLSVYQRGSLLDGLAMYLSCDTKKFHDNESTHILHNFWTSTHSGEASPPPWRRLCVSRPTGAKDDDGRRHATSVAHLQVCSEHTARWWRHARRK